MDFAFTPDEEALRAEVQAFIRAEFTPEVLADLQQHKLGLGFGPRAAAVLQKVRDRGWVAYSWPQQYGGQGGNRTTQFVIEEEFFRAAQIVVGGGGTGAPAILASGTEAQKEYYVPRVIRQEDHLLHGLQRAAVRVRLAGVRCRATRVGDKYRINGQKIFTTNAQVSTHLFLLVHTDPESRRQKGLSVLLVPMDTPGVTVRPLLTIQNEPLPPANATYAESQTNEVFFEDVEVDVSCCWVKRATAGRVASRGLNVDRVGAFRHLISISAMRTW